MSTFSFDVGIELTRRDAAAVSRRLILSSRTAAGAVYMRGVYVSALCQHTPSSRRGAGSSLSYTRHTHLAARASGRSERARERSTRVTAPRAVCRRPVDAVRRGAARHGTARPWYQETLARRGETRRRCGAEIEIAREIARRRGFCVAREREERAR